MTNQYFGRNVVISNKERNLAGFAACFKIFPFGRDDIKFMKTCTQKVRWYETVQTAMAPDVPFITVCMFTD